MEEWDTGMYAIQYSYIQKLTKGTAIASHVKQAKTQTRGTKLQDHVQTSQDHKLQPSQNPNMTQGRNEKSDSCRWKNC